METVKATRDPSTVKVGERVMFVLDRGRSAGEARPAFVVRKFGTEDMVNLMVLTDANNDVDPRDAQSASYGTGLVWATSVHYSQEPRPRTWHWLEGQE